MSKKKRTLEERPVTWRELYECLNLTSGTSLTRSTPQESVSDALLKSAGYKEPTVSDLSSRLRAAENRLSTLKEKLNHTSIFTRLLTIFKPSRGRTKYERIVTFRDFPLFRDQNEVSQRNSQTPPT